MTMTKAVEAAINDARAGERAGYVQTSRGVAAFKRPSKIDYLNWSGATDPGIEAEAVFVMCQNAYLGTFRHDGSRLNLGFNELVEEEGPAFLDKRFKGAAELVFSLAGARKREMGFLG